MNAPLQSVLIDLEPVVARELARHLEVAREWMPHEYVPWSRGRDFDGPMGGEEWELSQSTLDAVSRTALVVNLLTEDNLPSYHREIHRCMGADGAWGTWIGRWTAEEGRHGIAIRDYLMVTRAVDPIDSGSRPRRSTDSMVVTDESDPGRTSMSMKVPAADQTTSHDGRVLRVELEHHAAHAGLQRDLRID